VPSFVRSMARMAILRYAQEKGHTVITESIVEEATAQLMPGHAEQAMGEIVAAYDRGDLKRKPEIHNIMRWSEAATTLLLTIKDFSLRGNLSMRAEKKARTTGSQVVEAAHIQAFLDENVPVARFQPGTEAAALPGNQDTVDLQADAKQVPLQWQAAALARLMRVPEGFMRDSSRQRIEDYARNQGLTEISLKTAEAGLAEARKAMEEQMTATSATEEPTPDSNNSRCPFGAAGKAGTPSQESGSTAKVQWDKEAETLLNNVPSGFCRDMTRKAAQGIAARNNMDIIKPAFVQQVLQTFQSGSEQHRETMPWETAARERIDKAPDMVRGMLIKEIEDWSQRNGLQKVTEESVNAVKAIWMERGVFHLDPGDSRNG